MKITSSNIFELSNCSKGKSFLCEYSYAGERWSFQIYADSFEEAEQRLRKLSQGKVLGELKAEVEYGYGFGVITKTWVSIANFFNR